MTELRRSTGDELELLRRLVRGQVHRANNILTSLEFATATVIPSDARGPVRELIQELVGELNHLRSAALAGPQDMSFAEAITVAERLASHSSQGPEVVCQLGHVFSLPRAYLMVPFLCDLILKPGSPAVRRVEISSDPAGQLNFQYQAHSEAELDPNSFNEDVEGLRLWGAGLGLNLSSKSFSKKTGALLLLTAASPRSDSGKKKTRGKSTKATKATNGSKVTVKLTRLLVVEDDATLRRFFKASLKASGLEVEVAASGDEALSIRESFQPEAVLVDLRLGAEDGVEVAKRLNKRGHLPTLFMSGEVDVVPGDIKDLPLIGILSKPITASTILQTLAGYF